MSNALKSLFVLLALIHCNALLAAPQWVTHASSAGPDRAPVGASRFDQLFQDASGRYSIPYPFDELAALLATKVDNGNRGGVLQVIIPRGRSLQRDAAAPDFFRFPRALLTLQGEPAASAGADPKVFDYRLFIAHQPSVESLEVISYNDEAGRFEFQVVDNYGAGRQPRVRQANRRVCLSCHQNAAPIFSTRPWSETNFNFEIAGRLAAALPQRFASRVAALGADADVIDALIERANYLAAAQLVWQQGCGSAACRSALLRAVLQYRLSGNSSFDRDHRAYLDNYLANLERNWQRKWPDGLLLASQRIPDRDPFSARAMTRREDPLSLRAAHARWPEADAILADGIVARLAGFLTQADIQRIDRRLVEAGRQSAIATQSFETDCRLAHVSDATHLLECAGHSTSTGLRAVMELEYNAGEIESLFLLSLRMPGDAEILQPVVAELSSTSSGLRAQLVNRGGISMRLANGARLSALELDWQDRQLREKVRLRVTLTDEMGFLDAALETTLKAQQRGADSLGSKPFRRQAILAELERALWIEPGKSGQDATADGSLQLTRDSTNPATIQPGGDLALLRPYCAECHGADTQRPPGFLAGADAQQRIAQCAPRMLARLLAWQVSHEEAITAMPPPATIHAGWVRHGHYQRLVDALRGLLRESTAQPSAAVDAIDYDRLPPCLSE